MLLARLVLNGRVERKTKKKKKTIGGRRCVCVWGGGGGGGGGSSHDTLFIAYSKALKLRGSSDLERKGIISQNGTFSVNLINEIPERIFFKYNFFAALIYIYIYIYFIFLISFYFFFFIKKSPYLVVTSFHIVILWQVNRFSFGIRLRACLNIFYKRSLEL